MYPNSPYNYFTHSALYFQETNCTGRSNPNYGQAGDSLTHSPYYDTNDNFGNNTSYFTIGLGSTRAFGFHIDDDGALYIDHAIATDDIGSGFQESTSSNFINDPTSGVRYTRTSSKAVWSTTRNKWVWPGINML